MPQADESHAEPAQRILVVDDDASLLNMVRITLRASGFDVEVASDGIEGLECLNERPPFDLVLLDLQMPRMTGQELLKELRQRDTTTPVLIITAHEVGQSPEKLGAQRRLSKPFDPIDLVAVIEEMLLEGMEIKQ
jgi:DNA-binding response OmpR family regulator